MSNCGKFIPLLIALYDNNKQMIFNEQQGDSHLLQWFNAERRALGYRSHLKNLNESLKDNSILTFLMNVSPYFTKLPNLNSPTFIKLFLEFMELRYGKKLKQNKIVDLNSQMGFCIIIELCCYCCVQSENKQKYIDRILALSQSSQRYLMQKIEAIDSLFQNVMEVRQIISQVEELEVGNQELSDKIKEMEEKNNRLAGINSQVQKQNMRLKGQAESYNKQISNLYEKYNISSLEEYSQIYGQLEHDSNFLQDLYLKKEEQNREKQKTIHQLSSKIKEDYKEINNYSQELLRNKALIKEVESNKDLTQTTFSSFTKNSVCTLDEYDKQNIDAQLVLKDCLWVDEDNAQSVYKSNEKLMEKLQAMYKLYNQKHQLSMILQNNHNILCMKRTKNKERMKVSSYLEKKFSENYFEGGGKLTND